MGFKSFEDIKAGHLVKLVKIQAVTRREAKKAAQQECPLAVETALGLLDLIFKFQGTEPLSPKPKRGVPDSQIGQTGEQGHAQGTSREGYTLNQRGLLCYR